MATASARLGPGFYIKSTDTKFMLRKDRLFDFVGVTQRGEGGSHIHVQHRTLEKSLTLEVLIADSVRFNRTVLGPSSGDSGVSGGVISLHSGKGLVITMP